MAVLNSAQTLRFQSGCVLGIGADTISAGIGSGVATIEGPGPDKHQQYNGDALGEILPGKDRPAKITIRIRITQAWVSDALQSKLMPANTNGAITTFSFTITVPKFKGASGANTGIRWSFTSCYCPDGIKITPGEEYDTAEFMILANGGMPTPTEVNI